MDPSYNNSFGSTGGGGLAMNSGASDGMAGGVPGGMAQPIISSGDSGGVGLVMPRGRGKRRWPIVVVVMLVLVLAAVGVGVAVWLRGRGAEEGDVQSRYNVFANYVLSGKSDSSDAIGDYDIDAIYVIDNVLNNQDSSALEKKSFADEALKLWKVFYEQYQKTDYVNSDFLLLNSRVRYVDSFVNFLPIYYGLTRLTQAELMESYTSGGDAAVQELVDARYKELRESNNEFSREYGRLLVNLAGIEKEKVGVIVSSGCYNEMILNSSCVNDIAWPEAVNNSVAEKLALESRAGLFVMSQLEELEKSIFVINAQLSEPTSGMEEENE